MFLNKLHNNFYTLAQPVNTSFFFKNSYADLAFLNEKVNKLLNVFVFGKHKVNSQDFIFLRDYLNFVKIHKQQNTASSIHVNNVSVDNTLNVSKDKSSDLMDVNEQVNNPTNLRMLPNPRRTNFYQSLNDNAFYNGQYLHNFISEDKFLKISMHKNNFYVPYQYGDTISKRAAFFKNNWLPADQRLRKLIKRRVNLNFLNKPLFGPKPYKWAWLDELRSMVGLTTPRRLRRRELFSVRQVTPHELEQVGLGYLSDYYPYLRLWYYTTEPHEYQTLVADYAFETDVKAVYFYDVKMLYADFSELPFLGNHMTYSIESTLYNHFWAFSYFFHLPFTTVMLAYLILCFVIIFFLCCGRSLLTILKKINFFIRGVISSVLLNYNYYLPLFLNYVQAFFFVIKPYLHWVAKLVNTFIVTKTARGRLFLLKTELILPILNFFLPAVLRFTDNKFFNKLKNLYHVYAQHFTNVHINIFRSKITNSFIYTEICRIYKLITDKIIGDGCGLLLNVFYFGLYLSTTYSTKPSKIIDFFFFKFANYSRKVSLFFDSYRHYLAENDFINNFFFFLRQNAAILCVFFIPSFVVWLFSTFFF